MSSETLSYTRNPAAEQLYSPALHRVSQLTVLGTLVLIFMGGLVTSHGAGMSVPNWPNTYEHNMFTFPVNRWVGGVFYEHTHRLMGTVVGILSIAVAALAWIKDKRRWVRWLGVAVLGGVIAQGILGGLRVVWVNLDLAIVHACTAQVFLCVASLMAVVTSRWWLTHDLTRNVPQSLVFPLAVTVALIFGQLIVGALMRHNQAGLAIPDLPLAYGRLIPPTDQTGLAEANLTRLADPSLIRFGRVSLGQIWLHFGHRIGAVVVSLAILISSHMVMAKTKERRLRSTASALQGLWLLQVILGVLVVFWRRPENTTSLHVLVGALTLMTAFVLAVRTAWVAQGDSQITEVQPLSELGKLTSTVPA